MAFAYSSELALPLSLGHEEKLIELSGDEHLPAHELPADDLQFHELPAVGVDSPLQQLPEDKAPRPNKASRTFRHAQLAARQFIIKCQSKRFGSIQQRRRRADATPKRVDAHNRLPLCVIELVLANLDVRGVAKDSGEDDAGLLGVRAPERPCPTAAGELYDRLLYSRDVARWAQRSIPLTAWLLRSSDPFVLYDVAYCVTWAELPQLLKPVLAEMKACLSYIEAFQSCLDLKMEGCCYWLDISHLRQCVFRLTGFWPHDTEHHHEAWAFGLPEDLTRLLYPQGGKYDHVEMSMNLDEVVIGPAWDKLLKLEAITRLHQQYCS